MITIWICFNHLIFWSILIFTIGLFVWKVIEHYDVIIETKIIDVDGIQIRYIKGTNEVKRPWQKTKQKIKEIKNKLMKIK
jgi:hypothetical protein